jgi:hypothetical protein
MHTWLVIFRIHLTSIYYQSPDETVLCPLLCTSRCTHPLQVPLDSRSLAFKPEAIGFKDPGLPDRIQAQRAVGVQACPEHTREHFPIRRVHLYRQRAARRECHRQGDTRPTS